MAEPGRGGNAETLRRYWAEGEGAAKIRWGEPGDFNRCVAEVGKYMPGQAEGYCNRLHHRALGYYPATHAKMTNASHPTVPDQTLHLAAAPDPGVAVKRRMAQQGVALPDGSFRIPNVDFLRRAITAYGRCPEAKRPALVAHIRKRARALNAIQLDWVQSFLNDHTSGTSSTA